MAVLFSVNGNTSRVAEESHPSYEVHSNDVACKVLTATFPTVAPTLGTVDNAFQTACLRLS